MSVFNWCLTQQHKECRVRVERFYFGPVRKAKGRGTTIGLIMTDEWAVCECRCHKKGEK